MKADFAEKRSDSSGLSGGEAVTQPLCLMAAEGTFIPDVFLHHPQLGKVIRKVTDTSQATLEKKKTFGDNSSSAS